MIRIAGRGAWNGNSFTKDLVSERLARHFNEASKKSADDLQCRQSGFITRSLLQITAENRFEAGETLFRIPAVILSSAEWYMECLPSREADNFVNAFVNAILPSADLSGFWSRYCHWILLDELDGVVYDYIGQSAIRDELLVATSAIHSGNETLVEFARNRQKESALHSPFGQLFGAIANFVPGRTRTFGGTGCPKLKDRYKHAVRKSTGRDIVEYHAYVTAYHCLRSTTAPNAVSNVSLNAAIASNGAGRLDTGTDGLSITSISNSIRSEPSKQMQADKFLELIRGSQTLRLRANSEEHSASVASC